MEGLIFGILRYVLSLNFKNLLFRVLRKKPCSCQCFFIVFGLFSVAVAVSTHLCVICRHFCCHMSLFQGHVACWNLP